MRRWVLLVSVGLVLLGCTNTVVGSPTPVSAPGSDAPESSADSSQTPEDSTEPTEGADDGPEPDPDELAAGVTELFSGFNATWGQGFEAVAAYEAEHNHPTLAYSAQECLEGFEGLPPTYSESIVPDPGTLTPDPGWTISDGRFADAEINGHIYTVVTTYTFGDSAVETPNVEELTLHVAFLDGEVYFFFVCEVLE